MKSNSIYKDPFRFSSTTITIFVKTARQADAMGTIVSLNNQLGSEESPETNK